MEREEKSKESIKQEQCEQKVAYRTIVWADSEYILECCLEAKKQKVPEQYGIKVLSQCFRIC